ncbi:hypothetical protein BDP81DRAFT_317452, partial [Colletotrichum phormii]
YTEIEVSQALNAIINGTSVNKASIKWWAIPRLTLRNRIRGHQNRSLGFTELQRLNPWQENRLVKWIRI